MEPTVDSVEEVGAADAASTHEDMLCGRRGMLNRRPRSLFHHSHICVRYIIVISRGLTLLLTVILCKSGSLRGLLLKVSAMALKVISCCRGCKITPKNAESQRISFLNFSGRIFEKRKNVIF